MYSFAVFSPHKFPHKIGIGQESVAVHIVYMTDEVKILSNKEKEIKEKYMVHIHYGNKSLLDCMKAIIKNMGRKH